MSELEDKLREPFRELIEGNKSHLKKAESQMTEDRSGILGWPNYEKRLKDETFTTFDRWSSLLTKSAKPLKPSYFKKARRRLWFFEAGTWLHWRGIIVRMQILGMWTVRIGILAGIIALIYQLVRSLL